MKDTAVHRAQRDAVEALTDHWRDALESVQVLPGRVRGRVDGLFHVEVSDTVPPRAKVTGWGRDLSDLVQPARDGSDLAELLESIDVVMRTSRRSRELPAPRRSAAPGVGWSGRRDAAMTARARREAGETLTTRTSPKATAELIDQVWPGASVSRRDEGSGVVRFAIRPYGGNEVVVRMTPRGTLVVPVADGEGVPLPGGRSSITDGSPSRVLATLSAADEWLRRSAPTDDVLARPVMT